MSICEGNSITNLYNILEAARSLRGITGGISEEAAILRKKSCLPFALLENFFELFCSDRIG